MMDPLDILFAPASQGHAMGQTCSYGYGKVNLPGILATFSSMKVTAPFMRVSATTSGKRSLGAPAQTSRVGVVEDFGVLITSHVEHENGTVILLQAQWKRSGVPLRDGALFLRLRQGAPLYSILAKLPMHPQNLCGDSFCIFSGYADILNADELKLIGIEVNRNYTDRFMSEEELEECFEIREVAPETKPRPEISAVATPYGIEMREMAQPPARRLVFRRKK